MRVAVIVNLAVLRTESRLGHLEAHRKEAEDRDPQCSARTAEPNRDRDARDVAEPDRARNLGGKRLEAAHLTGVSFARVTPSHDVNRMLKSRDRLESQPHRHEDGRHCEPDDDQWDFNAADIRRVEHDRAHKLSNRCDQLVNVLVETHESLSVGPDLLQAAKWGLGH